MSGISGTNRLARLWLNLSLPAKGAVLIAVPLLCGFGMLALLADLQAKVEAANGWVLHTEQVLSQLRGIEAESLSSEAAVRGYLVSHDAAFLATHRRSRERVTDAFNRMIQLTADNPPQQERMRSAMQLIQEEMAALDAQAASHSEADLAAAVNHSGRRIDALLARIGEFEGEERRLLAARQERSEASRGALRYGVAGVTIARVFTAVAAMLLFTTSFKRRLDRIAANAARFARRESRGAVDGSRDAIGRLEQTLIATTRTLLEREQSLSENTADLERAKAGAEAAARAKSEFVATISHEIRSPMNALLGAADLLAATGLTEKQAEYVRMVERAGANLLSVVNEVLDISKIEAGRLELESVRFDCAAVVDRAVDLLSVTASAKGLELFAKYTPGVPRFVTGDPARLQRVLVNLISNAIKFTAMGAVAVKVELADVPDLTHFSVTDTGIGIPRDRQEAVFQQFTQAGSSTTREYGGTGLGLSIARTIVELMGGRIWVESEAGAGSTFHFTAALPPAAAPAAAPLVTAAAAAGLRANGEPPVRAIDARVLLADDSPSNLALIKAYLSGTGCVLDFVADGEAALERLTTGRYNLVLMDVQMPKLDGYEVTRRFREWERAGGRPRTPVVAVTAHAFQEDIEQALKAGADGHLTKPIRRETLLEAIELYQRPDGAADVRVNVPEFIRELAPEFLRRQRYGLLTVVTALKKEEFAPIQSFAHNMKGCGRSFGFPRLTDLGREMELAAKDCDAERVRKQARDLREYLTEVDIA